MASSLFTWAIALSGVGLSLSDLSAQLNADRAHAEALGLSKGSVSAKLECKDRVNVESCLGTMHRDHDCAWCDGKCRMSPHFAKTSKCHELGDADDQAVCFSCRFRFTCSEWVQTQAGGGCDPQEKVVTWGDDDPKDYSSYRAFSGYSCKDSTCDTKDQCCYGEPKPEQKTCKSYPADLCTKFNRLPKMAKGEIPCRGSSCLASECCDDTCMKPNWGYCRKGTLKPDDKLKTIRCITPSKYTGAKPECSDEQCCDAPEEKFSVTAELVSSDSNVMKSAGACAISGVVFSALAVLAVRRRASRGADIVEPAATPLDGCE